MSNPTPAAGRVVQLDHPLVVSALAEMRHKDTPTPRFRARVRELAKFLIYEATRDLETDAIEVPTPLAVTEGRTLGERPLIVAPILRAGLAMMEPATELLPEAQVRHIGLYRNEETLQPVEYYLKLPGEIGADATVLILDPMLATGGSATATIEAFKRRKAQRIKFLCLIAAPEGVRHVHAAHPDVPIYCVSVDSHLNEQGYIVPGLGDAGDRAFGTVHR
ncbi:MAG: uracil phosphoribosyltransferase [Candidatus Sericytochromatia bacterium]|nr:uracil phosphoribosyltransferase [Candidatus Sericytochromatia bacterium]